MINYGLECFANLGIAYIYHSTYQLFEYKFCIGKFVFGGLNIYKCFLHYVSFQKNKQKNKILMKKKKIALQLCWEFVMLLFS